MSDPRAERERYAARVRGCLLGGAVGDALGAPVEFWSLDEIRAAVGPDGVRSYLPYGPDERFGLITDDTQMTLFTVEGLIGAGIRRDRGLGFTVAVVHAAYDRWLDTQLRPAPDPERYAGWLASQPWLYARRAPGRTCLDALTAARAGEPRIRQYGGAATNDSKGCGGVMRSAPFGLLPSIGPERAFAWAAEAAGYTHGHVTGRLASGTLAATIAALVEGATLDDALDTATSLLRSHPAPTPAAARGADAGATADAAAYDASAAGASNAANAAAAGAGVGAGETLAALAGARSAASSSGGSAEVLESLGAGWVAEEALAIAVYAALCHPGPDEVLDALALAVTHSGDTDSTGAICGNILGALHGDTALPPVLTFEVEGRGTILELAHDFVWEFTNPDVLHGDYGPHTRWTHRY